jgi:hypothetical protein
MHSSDVSRNRILLICIVAVAASTILFPTVRGYGTVLFQIVALGGWTVMAAITSGCCTDSHYLPVFCLELLLNLAIILIPAGLLWITTRRRWRVQGSVAVIVWCAFYLCCLFFLFPATDGP